MTLDNKNVMGIRLKWLQGIINIIEYIIYVATAIQLEWDMCLLQTKATEQMMDYHKQVPRQRNYRL